MNHDLLKKKCEACEGGAEPLTREEAESYMAEVPGWVISPDAKMITKKYIFKNFLKAMAFVDSVADVAEMEGHHPDIHISYSRVSLELYTHSIKGLSENDFIVAAKVDQIPLF